MHRFDYTAVGHVTVDVLADGSRRPGGSAFYSALQASRLGCRTLILTRGVQREIDELLEPYAGEFELVVEPAPRRRRRCRHRAGARRAVSVCSLGRVRSRTRPEIDTADPSPRTGRARDAARAGAAWARTSWGSRRRGSCAAGASAAARISLTAGPAGTAAGELDALVVSELERAACAELIAGARAAGAVTAVTAGSRPITILLPDSTQRELPVSRLEGPLEDLGAGDVFAAAFFIALAEGRAGEAAAAFANAAAAVRMRGGGACRDR